MIPSPRLALRRRRKIVVALGASAALALSGLSIESASASTRSSLALSLSPDRSSAVRLDSSTVNGNIYVFVKSRRGLDKVDFYLDGWSEAKPPVQTDTNPPFDFAGTAVDGTALPYDTTKLADGSHTMRAVLTWSDGATSSRGGNFRVANSGATATPTASPTISTTTSPKATNTASPTISTTTSPKATNTASPTAPTTTVPATTAAPTTVTTATPTRTATAASSTSTAAPAAPTASATTTLRTPTPSLTTSTIANLPAQAAGITYGGASGAAPYAHPGGLVVAGRDNYQGQAFKDVSAAGGSVLIYLDAIIDNPYGRYHDLLNNPSECGPATARWPGNYKANSWGYLNDFRVGSVLQSKLKCVLEKMVAENPHMAGWLADDLGSRSWFPDLDWASFPDKAAYRAGAIALTQTLRTVANEHGLVFIVNGTWSANNGGGYPDASKPGNALADGGFVEHHDGEIAYFGPYGCSAQWAAQSPITKGKAINYAVTYTAAGKAQYVDSNCYAYVNQQSDYSGVAPWGTFHATGLPSRVVQ
jgi:hypothetical protein